MSKDTIILIAIGVIILVILLFIMSTYIEHCGGLTIMIVRFAIGHHLDGEKRTNYGWSTRGKDILTDHGKASKWCHRHMRERVIIRWSIVLGISLIIYGVIAARFITIVACAFGFIVATAYGINKGERKLKGRHHFSAVLQPLASALAMQLGESYMNVCDSLVIDPLYASKKSLEDIGTLVLPDFWAANPGQRESIEHLFSSRLGVELHFSWQTNKHPMTLKIQRAPIPRKLVPFSEMVDVMRQLAKDTVLLGVTGRGENKFWNMAAEDPHMAVQANTRRGKTRLLLLIVVQILRQGAEKVSIIDPKRVGVDAVLNGIDGVTIHSNPKDIQGMWDTIHEFKEFMDSRVEAFEQDRTLEFDRALLAIDEVSMFAQMSKQYWDLIKPPKARAIPPVWNDIAAILWQGAQFSCNVLIFGQRLDSGIVSGLLEVFGTRLLAGFTKRAYERLIGIPPIPVSSRHRGRFIYFDGDDPIWIQTVLEKDDIVLRNYALEGQKKKPSIKETLERIEANEKVN